MKTLKHTTLIAFALFALSGVATSCKKGCTDPKASNYDEDAKKEDKDVACEYDTIVNSNMVKSGSITSSETWTSNNIYELEGKVVVESGATLTIEAGTIVKGQEGQETNASALIVAKGGKLMAIGTAADPIIFTSILDNIEFGHKVGSNLTKTDNQKWGGIVILGNAPVGTENGDTEGNIEGIPADAGYGKYGGSVAADNSGTLTYVSIRHGGITIGEGNELNGLTLGGVGSGTIISNIEVYATLDDGIECFGGTVNISNALVFYQGDDGIDLDQNYSGTIENFAVIHGDGIETDEGLEIDGPEGSTNTTGLFTLKNGLVKTQGIEGSAGDFKSKAQGTIQNVTFTYPSAKVKVRASYQNDCADSKTDAFTHLTDANPTLVFTNTKFDVVSVYTSSTDNANANDCTVFTADQTAAEALITSGSGSTINPVSLFSWTAARINNEL